MVLSKEAMEKILEAREKKFPNPSTQMENYPEGVFSPDYVLNLSQYYWFKDYKKQVKSLLNKGKIEEAEQMLLFDVAFGPGLNGTIREPKNRAIKLLLEATY